MNQEEENDDDHCPTHGPPHRFHHCDDREKAEDLLYRRNTDATGYKKVFVCDCNIDDSQKAHSYKDAVVPGDSSAGC
jgi:hypothetical protein